jgi:N-acetylmuramoyl-L-alanine amidase
MRRARLLHVLACAPAAVLVTVAPALSTPAVEAASVPPPFIVCIDPGHGGVDPGAIGLDGLVEKDLTLDVADRLAALLRADGVTVVMTRTTDASVSITERAEIANSSHANVFLPIYFNSWTTPTPDGSVVLYPYARDIPFAEEMSKAVTTYIGPYGDSDGGIVLRNDWWLTPTMPVATVESLFISNPHDAALLTQPSFREGLAEALRNGILMYLPGILQRLKEVPTVAPGKLRAASGPLAAPNLARSSATGGGRSAGAAGAASSAGLSAVVQVLGWLLLIGLLLLAVRHRRRLIPLAGGALGRLESWSRNSGLHHWVLRRRRRRVRERADTLGGDEGEVAPPLYVELFAPTGGGWRPATPDGERPAPERAAGPSVEVRGRKVPAVSRPSLDELPL